MHYTSYVPLSTIAYGHGSVNFMSLGIAATAIPQENSKKIKVKVKGFDIAPYEMHSAVQ